MAITVNAGEFTETLRRELEKLVAGRFPANEDVDSILSSYDRAVSRALIATYGGQQAATEVPPMTRGQKAAQTRRANLRKAPRAEAARDTTDATATPPAGTTTFGGGRKPTPGDPALGSF